MFTYEIKKSKFIAYAFDISSKNEVKEIIKNIKSDHPDARHVCYAFVTSDGGGMSDDGEPSGTAGKPLFRLLELKKTTNKLVVVVRYFGGTKLGAGGLIRAYVEAGKNVI